MFVFYVVFLTLSNTVSSSCSRTYRCFSSLSARRSMSSSDVSSSTAYGTGTRPPPTPFCLSSTTATSAWAGHSSTSTPGRRAGYPGRPPYGNGRNFSSTSRAFATSGGKTTSNFSTTYGVTSTASRSRSRTWGPWRGRSTCSGTRPSSSLFVLSRADGVKPRASAREKYTISFFLLPSSPTQPRQEELVRVLVPWVVRRSPVSVRHLVPY